MATAGSQVLDLPMRSRMRLAAPDMCRGLVQNPTLWDAFAQLAQGTAPPVFELPVERLVALERTAENTPESYRAALGALGMMGHGGGDDTMSAAALHQLVAEMAGLSIGAAQPFPMPVWPAGTRDRPVMLVPDPDGPIAAASWVHPVRRGASASLYYVLPLIAHKCAAALQMTRQARHFAEWHVDVRVATADGDVRYTLLMRAATETELRRRKLWPGVEMLGTHDIVEHMNAQAARRSKPSTTTT
jgi:hypothetical protein